MVLASQAVPAGAEESRWREEDREYPGVWRQALASARRDVDLKDASILQFWLLHFWSQVAHSVWQQPVLPGLQAVRSWNVSLVHQLHADTSAVDRLDWRVSRYDSDRREGLHWQRPHSIERGFYEGFCGKHFQCSWWEPEEQWVTVSEDRNVWQRQVRSNRVGVSDQPFKCLAIWDLQQTRCFHQEAGLLRFWYGLRRFVHEGLGAIGTCV